MASIQIPEFDSRVVYVARHSESRYNDAKDRGSLPIELRVDMELIFYLASGATLMYIAARARLTKLRHTKRASAPYVGVCGVSCFFRLPPPPSGGAV
jgi:hypothetical protein